ncbi:MAG: primosomal protein N', partial [Candidatus Tectomicrobia bacterium]|nr:primosomal protein N' [Candidatus Tectomicrobia bacterium]
LGVIIIDEEHDPSYKQGENPRYHARDVGIMRGRLVGCPVILGSATPSLESAYNAKIGKYHYLHLPERVESRSLPLMDVVDMTGEMRRGGDVAILSSKLREAIGERLQKGEQVLLFLNRRGFARFIQCEECGWVFQCPNCSVTLIYHLDEEGMVCHYCGYTEPMKDFCPDCRGFRLHPYGIGIERVEEEVKASFPEATVARMDRDTTRGRWSHARILKEFFRGKIQTLIGTQMIAKGHDFPNITLVGVISADSSLHLPDFRASERTFQLLIQVGGRAGRGEKGGEVIVQTYHPHHFSIQRAQAYDFAGFYEAEVALRKELHYPPYSRITAITFEGGNSEKVEKASRTFGKILQSENRGGKILEILGPSKAMVWKIKNRFRWQILLKGNEVTQMHTLLRRGLERFKRDYPEGKDVKVIVDVDPQQFF